MLNFKAIALASALVMSTASLAVAADSSALDALSSASSVSFQTVSAGDVLGVQSGTGLGMTDQVDLGSLKARIQGNAKLLAQLDSYGATLDDVIGISGSNETDVTILVQG